MRQITKDIQSMIDGSPQGFRLTKPDAFSGVEILRLQEQWESAERNVEDGSVVPHTCNKQNCPLVPLSLRSAPSVLDLITSLSADELRSVMTSCLNHVSVLLPAVPGRRTAVLFFCPAFSFPFGCSLSFPVFHPIITMERGYNL